MSADQTANLLYALLFLVLVVSSLVARKLPLAQTLKYALAWAAIFAGDCSIFVPGFRRAGVGTGQTRDQSRNAGAVWPHRAHSDG